MNPVPQVPGVGSTFTASCDTLAPVLDWYPLKRRLLKPYVWAMQRITPSGSDFHRAMLLVYSYRPIIFRFGFALWRRPTLLCDGMIPAGGAVMDVGAADGTWTATVRQLHRARVYAFEPLPDQCQALKIRFAGDESVSVHCYGLSSADGIAQLSLLGLGSSVYTDRILSVFDEPAPQQVVVQMRDVVRVMDELGILEVELLKLNIEGGEYDLLDRLIDTGYIERVGSIVVQFHEWFEDAYARRRRIHRGLARTHTIDWDYPFVWERWTRRVDFRSPPAGADGGRGSIDPGA